MAREAAFERLRREMPGASEERCWAVVKRTFEDSLAMPKNPHFEHQSCKKKSSRLRASSHSRRFKQHFHPGKFDICVVENCEVWTCCLNADKDSVGCHTRVVNRDAWCLLSPA
ncbi:hypothetical protein CSUI_003758 [Cystoisospora suis]|uniref:Uncharacterized protein n=1 Tax=Cystoisospora suis TaxID=483139 RepID=A0A2C6KPH3_9APIC|nr:hypothetical protein CSUI_003758 [Cystoisospora suis]